MADEIELIDSCRRYLPADCLEIFECALAGGGLTPEQRTRLIGGGGAYLGSEASLALRAFLLSRAKQTDPSGTAERLRDGARVFALRVAQREARQREHNRQFMRQGKQRR